MQLLELVLFLVVAAIGWGMLTRKKKKNSVPAPSSATLFHSHATSYGYKKVGEEEKTQKMIENFDSLVLKYDLTFDIIFFGLNRVWRDRLVSKLNPFPGMKHIDMAGGTGEVAFKIIDAIKRNKSKPMHQPQDDLPEETQIYVCDINANMLNFGKMKATKRDIEEQKSLIWVEEKAEKLRFEDNSMDSYTIGFGIRNFTHMEKALAEAYRVLKPGGRLLIVEFFAVETPVFKQLYDLYSFTVIPLLGKIILGNRDSCYYFVESIRRFPPQETFAAMIAEAGFKKVEYENLHGGVVAVHCGFK